MWFLETWRWLGTCAFVQTVENLIGQLCLQLSMRKTTNCYKLNCCLSGFLIPKVGFRKKHLTQRPWSKVFNIKASREYYNLTYRFSLFVLPSSIKHAVLHLFTTFPLELNFVVFFSYCFYVSIPYNGSDLKCLIFVTQVFQQRRSVVILSLNQWPNSVSNTNRGYDWSENICRSYCFSFLLHL